MNLGLSANIQRMVVADSVENPRQLLVTKVQIVQRCTIACKVQLPQRKTLRVTLLTRRD